MVTLLFSYLVSPLVMLVTYLFSRVFVERKAHGWTRVRGVLVCLFTLAPWLVFSHFKKDGGLGILTAVFGLNLLVFTLLEISKPKPVEIRCDKK